MQRIVVAVLAMILPLSFTLFVMAAARVQAYVTPVSEAQKIEYLIRSVEELSNAKFIRNGRAYDAQRAADHLRLKLRNAESRCNTVDEFIRVCGSRSSISGQPYQIRFADGTLMTSESFLRAKLKELNPLSKDR